jgi:hypothetical protein
MVNDGWDQARAGPVNGDSDAYSLCLLPFSYAWGSGQNLENISALHQSVPSSLPNPRLVSSFPNPPPPPIWHGRADLSPLLERAEPDETAAGAVGGATAGECPREGGYTEGERRADWLDRTAVVLCGSRSASRRRVAAVCHWSPRCQRDATSNRRPLPLRLEI